MTRERPSATTCAPNREYYNDNLLSNRNGRLVVLCTRPRRNRSSRAISVLGATTTTGSERYGVTTARGRTGLQCSGFPRWHFDDFGPTRAKTKIIGIGFFFRTRRPKKDALGPLVLFLLFFFFSTFVFDEKPIKRVFRVVSRGLEIVFDVPHVFQVSEFYEVIQGDNAWVAFDEIAIKRYSRVIGVFLTTRTR